MAGEILYSLRFEHGVQASGQWAERAFRRLQTELAEREKALRVAIAEVSTLQALLETERQSSTYNPTTERELVRLRHSHDKLREVARDLGFDAVGLLRTHA